MEAIVVVNYDGRRLDGAPSVARMLPRIADAVGDDLLLLADSARGRASTSCACWRWARRAWLWAAPKPMR